MNAYAIISPMIQIGDQVDRYQIQSHLAQGGMSDVYRAFDLVGRREVALKIPDESMIGDPAQYERFQRELEVMTTLDHPAILKGLDTGRFNRIPYLVTGFVEGRSLRAMLETGVPIPPEKAVELAVKTAEGMAYCHANGVVHRDLKPENILVSSAGQPVIMDFGLALTKGSHRVTYSNLSATMGTPDYMAPEQIDGQRGDARTDVYALGTILYEMLAGRTPFTGDTQLAVMAQHLNGVAPRLDKLNPAISPHLAAVVAKALQKEPAARYADMPAFIQALQHPEQADLSILEQKAGKSRSLSLEQAQVLKALLVAVLVLGILAGAALLLQALHR
jgi:eukaryotic-like serine/threonine-protein kinase